MGGRGRATRCGRERIPTRTESAIRARFVRDSFHSLSTGAPTAFPVAWRACLIWPLRLGKRAECDVGWAAFYPRWLSAKIGRSLGYFIGPITTISAMRMPWRVFVAGRAGLGEIDHACKDGVAYLRGQRCPHSPQMHSPGTWKPMISKLRRYTASHRVPGNGKRTSDDQLPVRMGVCGP